jgi:CDGSH-type Zn-finger protein
MKEVGMSEAPSIESRPNGPYMVKGLDDLRDARGRKLAAQPQIALCRCGGSANKPFCDGTHKKIGFSSAKIADGSADRRDTYRGKRVAIHDNRSLCAHAGYCSSELAAVFKYGAEPWIDADGAALEAIVATIRKCPSGALSYSLEGVEHRDQARPAAISATKDGPYAVVGRVRLDAISGKGASSEHYTLCRCGASKNKPFCDGSHWEAGFKDGA